VSVSTHTHSVDEEGEEREREREMRQLRQLRRGFFTMQRSFSPMRMWDLDLFEIREDGESV
jgi:hypothetical protein